MKTTIEINDDLLADAKAFAIAHRTSLRRVLEDALVLLVRQKGGVTKGGIKLRKHPFRGKGLTPQAQNMSQREIRELAYAGRGGKEAGDDRAGDDRA
jgi:hypothetical protein